MRPLAAPASPSVADYFDRVAGYWDAVYAEAGVQGEVYRAREAAVLELLDGLRLPPGARVLEIGCGTGRLALELGRRHLRVDAVDPSPAMVERARARAAAEQGLLIDVRLGSAEWLPFAGTAFAAVLAVGLLPWLREPASALREVVRVTRPGGAVIVTADNRRRLNAALDPWLSARLQPVKRRLRQSAAALAFGFGPEPGPISRYHAPREIDDLLVEAGCRPVARRCVGFGPLSLFRREVLPANAGVAVHRRLQRMADAGRLGLAERGSHYIVMAERRLNA